MGQLGRYRLTRRLGSGGMGEVWEARGPAGPVAVKWIVRSEERFASALRREVRALASLDHPGIVRILDQGVAQDGVAGVPAGSPWFAMERADGTLLDVSPGSWRATREVLCAVLDALAHAHARGLVHLDLKPSNVLRFREAGRHVIRLADFGVAAAFRRLSQGGSVGSRGFMAPEQRAGQWRSYGPSTDLFAVGLLARGLMTGHYRADAPLTPRSAPEGLDDWARWLTRSEPSERPAHAAAALRALQALPEPEEEGPARGPTRGPAAGTLHTCHTLVSERTIAHTPHLGTRRTRATALPDWRLPDPPPRIPVGPRLVAMASTRLAGREAERDRLWAAVGRVVLQDAHEEVRIDGPDGVGRSALGRWLVHRVRELGVAEGFDTDDGLRASVSHALRLVGASWTEVCGAVDVVWAEASATDRHALASLISGHRAVPLQERVEVVSRWLATRAPVVVWLDALESTADGQALATRLEGVPGCLVIRTGDVTPPASDTASALHLEPLGPPERVRLFKRRLDLHGDLAASLSASCGGDLGLAAELVRVWLASDALRPTPWGWELREPLELMAAVERVSSWGSPLPRALRAGVDPEVIEACAVLGSRVSEEALARLVPDALRREQAVDGLLTQGLLHPTATGLRWGHAVARQAVVRACRGTPRWQRLATAALHGASGTERVRLLAEAGRPDEAAEHLRAFLPELGAEVDLVSMLALIDHVAAALEAAGRSADDPADGQVRMARVQIWRRMGRRDEVSRELPELLRDAELRPWPIDTRAWILTNAGGHCGRWEGVEAGERLFRQALALEPAPDLVAQVLDDWIWLLLHTGHVQRARALLSRARDAQSQARPRTRIKLLRRIAYLEHLDGDVAGAHRTATAAADGCRALQDRQLLSFVLMDLALLEFELGRPEQASRTGTEAVRIADELGLHGANHRLALAHVEAQRGRGLVARRLLEDVHAQARLEERIDNLVLASVFSLLPDALLEDWEAWDAHLEEVAQGRPLGVEAHARGLHLGGEEALRRGQRARARTALLWADEVYARLGKARDAAACRALAEGT